jgi:hypothetical protein
MTEPFFHANPGDPILSDHWNTMQINVRDEIAAKVLASIQGHAHTGGNDGPKLGGTGIDPAAVLTIQQLSATSGLSVKAALDTSLGIGISNTAIQATGTGSFQDIFLVPKSTGAIKIANSLQTQGLALSAGSSTTSSSIQAFGLAQDILMVPNGAGASLKIASSDLSQGIALSTTTIQAFGGVQDIFLVPKSGSAIKITNSLQAQGISLSTSSSTTAGLIQAFGATQDILMVPQGTGAIKIASLDLTQGIGLTPKGIQAFSSSDLDILMVPKGSGAIKITNPNATQGIALLTSTVGTASFIQAFGATQDILIAPPTTGSIKIVTTSDTSQGLALSTNTIKAFKSTGDLDIVVTPQGNGGVGIGTSALGGFKLNVNGNTSITGTGAFTGSVGIGAPAPASPVRLEVSGGSLMVSHATGNGDINLNSKTRPTIFPSGTNLPLVLGVGTQGLQVRSAGTGVLQLNADNSGDVTIATGGGNVGVGKVPVSPYRLDVAGHVRAERLVGNNTLGLADFQTINPASNVFIHSTPGDRDGWLLLDSADTTSNWGIYHRQMDSTVKNLPANSIGFIGGGASALQAYVCLGDGTGYFAGGVGVGATPAGLAKLEVGGDIRFTGELKTAQLNHVSPFYIRGSGLNNPVNAVVKIGSTLVVNVASRGLTLTRINKSDHSVISAATTYDTYGDANASNNLATALNGMTDQIGILVSWDAWELNITTALQTAFSRLGLSRAALVGPSNVAREPYAAIFETSSLAADRTGKAIEVLHTAPSSPPADIRGWLMDGSFSATGDVPMGPRVTQVFNNTAGALPKSGTFFSGGGTLVIFASGSAWFNGGGGGVVGMDIQIDSVTKGGAIVTTNENNSHKSLVANALVVTGVAAGSHTLTLALRAGATTDVNDFFSATVMELPY